MLNNLIIAFEVVAPFLILMTLGKALLKVNIFDSNLVRKMNSAVFRVFLPVLIFNNLYTSRIDDVKDIGTALYAAAFLFAAYVICFFIIPLVEKDRRKCGVMIQGICRSNYVIFGVPLCQAISGDGVLGKISVSVAIVIPVINIMATLSLELFRGEKSEASLKKVFIGILKNPLIISSAIGIVFLLLGIKLPNIIEKSVSEVAKIATPLAIILLGASINFSTVLSNIRQLITVLLGKLIIVPLIGISLAAIMGMRGEDIAILIAALASPVAVSSYPMALEMDGDGDLAAQIVAFSTTFCIITVFLWVFALKQIGLI